MHVLVLISGVADPKWPLPPAPDAAVLAAHGSRHAVLSPFDEAALELALQLRDADPSTTIHAAVAGPESLARKVAEWRLDGVRRLPPLEAPWDVQAGAQALAQAVAPLASPAGRVLMGREFGDWDDGTIPALVARLLGLPHVPLSLGVDGRQGVTRQRGGLIERVVLPGPALLSVTNDARNRLRLPLLKNVMAARKMQFETLPAGAAGAVLQLDGMLPAPAPVREAACRMLEGGVGQQALALAALLREEGALA